jgi:hypothetical protein
MTGMQVTNADRSLPHITLIGFGSVLVLFFTGMRYAPARATACDCPTVRWDDAFCNADLVLEGNPLIGGTVHVVGGMKNSTDHLVDEVALRSQVDRLLKGKDITKLISVNSMDREGCGFNFIPGQRYLLFTTTENGMPVMDRCSQTRALDTVTTAFTDSLSNVMSGQQSQSRRQRTLEPCFLVTFVFMSPALSLNRTRALPFAPWEVSVLFHQWPCTPRPA